MTTPEHVERVRAWRAAQSDHAHDACHIDAQVCRCATCGVTTQLVRGKLVSRGWDRDDAKRVTTVPPTEAASYPYLASVRVDGREVYRVLKDLAEATDADIIADIEAALGRTTEKPSC